MPNARDQGLVDFFESMLEYHDRCAQDLGESRLDFCIAGKPVRIRFAGNSLQHLARPLAHRTPDATTGEEHPAPLENHPAPLEIFVCGGASTGMQAPLPPWQVEAVSQDQMHSWRLENGDILVNHMPAYSFLCLFDCRTQRAVYWVDDVAQLPFWEIAAPFLVIFSWWAAGFGGQIAHAAAVGRSGSGLLLVGRGGSGKSTTAAACIDAGMEYVSDDYVLLTSDPDPTAHCLYSSAKLHMHVLHQHFPRWQERVSQQVGPDAKAVFFLQRSCPTQLRDALKICGIARPTITQRNESTWVTASKSEILLGLGPSTVFQLPARRQHGLSFLAGLVRQLPSYRLELGPVHTAAVAIDDLLVHEARRAA